MKNINLVREIKYVIIQIKFNYLYMNLFYENITFVIIINIFVHNKYILSYIFCYMYILDM